MKEDNQNALSSIHIKRYLSSILIEDMALSRRAKNPLLRAGLKTALDIQKYIETDALHGIYSVGPSLVTEIEDGIKLLLEDKGTVQGMKLFVEDVSQTATIPSVLYNDLPIDLLAKDLGDNVVDQLKSIGFEKIGKLLHLSQTVVDFIRSVSVSLNPLIKYQKSQLQKAVAIGKLHPSARYHDNSIQSWLDLMPQDHDKQLELLKLLAQANEINSLNKELLTLMSRVSDREFKFYIQYFHENLTLEQVGKHHGVSRERARQIISKVSSKLWSQINRSPALYLQTALLVAQDMGDKLSLRSWEKALTNRQIIELHLFRETVDSFDVLCALLRSSDKVKYPPRFEIFESIKFILNSSSNLSLGLIKAIEEMSSKAKRKIRRKVSYVGGIHLIEASELLDAVPKQAAEILKHLGYKEIIPEWYTITFREFNSRWPILKAGLTMMEACGPLEFSLFCDGIRRYISRFYDVIAPQKVIQEHLKILGFEIEGGYVCWHETPSGYLAESDECFLHSIEKYGSVVSFQEVVEVFQERGFSIASATARVLPQSPIVEKVDMGLYKIRGYEHGWDDIEKAKNRQETIDRDPEVTYGVDGITRYRITLGSWALNGVISISTSQQPLPDLGDGWDVLIENKAFGIARRDEYLIWGLGSAFNALGVQIGDRIELAFDAWQDPVIRIRKI
jgi:hypothetical protein